MIAMRVSVRAGAGEKTGFSEDLDDKVRTVRFNAKTYDFGFEHLSQDSQLCTQM